MLPSLLRAKIDHPSFANWKTLSISKKEDWSTMQVTFLREANSIFGVNQDISTRFRAANQKLEEDEGLTNEEKE
eukprot:1360678-Ditylum_brightwellii.AAC.1